MLAKHQFLVYKLDEINGYRLIGRYLHFLHSVSTLLGVM
jgi:hypothetical protein